MIDLRLNAYEHQEDEEQQKRRRYPEHRITMARSMVSPRSAGSASFASLVVAPGADGEIVSRSEISKP